MIKTTIAFALTVFALQANAESELEEKAKVLSLMKKHSETVACVTDFEETPLESLLQNVFTLERETEDGFQSTYYVLWGGDMGCSGGSGTHSYHISEIGRDLSHRPFIVRNNDAFGEHLYKKINTRFIEKMEMISPEKFKIISLKHAENDANNFPSVKYEYTLERIDWQWVVTDEVLLSNN